MLSSNAIGVVVRVRAQEGSKCVSVRRDNELVLHGSTDKVCTFDLVFDEDSTQQQVFDKVGRPLCEHALGGYNNTIIAYGQTGAGKTYTMHGPEAASDGPSCERGLVPRVLEHL